MKCLKKCLSWTLPLLIISGLWIVAEDSQEAERLETALRYVPAIQIAGDMQHVYEPSASLGASLLRALMPA